MWCRGTSAPSHAQRLLYNMNCILLLSQHTAYHICAVYIFAACLHICCITVAVLRSLVRSPYPAPLLWRQQVCRYLKAADYQTSLWFCDSCSCTLHCTNTLLWQLFLHTALYKYIVVTAVPAHCIVQIHCCDSCSCTLHKYIVVTTVPAHCIVQIHCCQLVYVFLGAFATLRKATISFVMSVRLSVRMEQLGSHWTGFHEIWYCSIFRKSVEKIQVSLNSDKNNGTVHEDRCTVFDHISLSST